MRKKKVYRGRMRRYKVGEEEDISLNMEGWLNGKTVEGTDVDKGKVYKGRRLNGREEKVHMGRRGRCIKNEG